MRRRIVLFPVGSPALLVPMLATAAERIGAEEARAVGIDAYVYLYPLVTMDVTRKRFTNIEPGKAIGRGPMNTVSNVAEHPSADCRAVVRPNLDTLQPCRFRHLIL